jgi:hypothetical protein
MRHPAFAVLACVWLALFGLGLVRPTYGTALREAEGAGPVDSAASPDQDVQGGPFDAWARAFLLVLLCLPRWRAMDRLWRVVAGLTLFATAVALVLPFGLLPRTAPWGNLTTLTTAGTWLLALGVVVGDRRWLAPQLLAAVVWLMVAPIAAFFVPGLAPVGLLVVRLGAVYTITVLLLVLLFVLMWRRQSGHPGRIDEPPLVAAQPV